MPSSAQISSACRTFAFVRGGLLVVSIASGHFNSVLFSPFLFYTFFFFGNLRPRPGILGIPTAISSTIPTLTSSSNFKFQDSGRL